MRAHLLTILATTLALTACGDEFGEDDTTSSTGTTLPSGTGASGGSGATGGEPSSGGSGGVPAGTGGSGGVPIDYHHDITVVDQHATPIANAPLVINGADGKVIDTGMTDANGQATLEIPEGGSISAFWETPTAHTVDVVHQPPVGAPITLFVKSDEPAMPAPTDFNFYVYGYPANTYSVTGYNGCNTGTLEYDGSFETSVEMTDEGCSSGATEDFLFVARAANQSILGWLLLEDEPTNPGNSGGQELGISGGEPVLATSVEIGGGDNDVPFGLVSVTAELAGVRYDDVRTAQNIDDFPLIRDMDVPDLTGAIYTTLLFALYENTAQSSKGVALTRVGDLPPSLTFDLATATAATLAPVDNTDGERPKLTWEVDGNASIDVASIILRWNIAGDAYSYRARVPADVDTFQVLEIPDALAPFRPTVDGGDDEEAVYLWVDSTAVDGYVEGVSFDPDAKPPAGTHYSGTSSQSPP